MASGGLDRAALMLYKGLPPFVTDLSHQFSSSAPDLLAARGVVVA